MTNTNELFVVLEYVQTVEYEKEDATNVFQFHMFLLYLSTIILRERLQSLRPKEVPIIFKEQRQLLETNKSLHYGRSATSPDFTYSSSSIPQPSNNKQRSLTPITNSFVPSSSNRAIIFVSCLQEFHN